MPATSPYQPHYDPLRDSSPGTAVDYAPTYWRHHAGQPPEDDGPVNTDLDVDVASIGGGFTGLATALFLAREHGIKATVLEANQIGWGCTSRNGGQGHLACGRLSRSQWVAKWGNDLARRLHANSLEGFEVFKAMTENPEIDSEPHGNGNLLIAHGDHALKGLRAEARLCEEVMGYKTRILDRNTVLDEYVGDQECHGAMLEPVGIAVQPLKLAYGYARVARRLGARVHTGSPVQAWNTEAGVHHLSSHDEMTQSAPSRGESSPVGDQIRELRRAKRMTIDELARRVGKSIGYISQIERNISAVSIETLSRISDALDVQIGWFFQVNAVAAPEERDCVVRRDNRRRLSFTSGLVEELLSPNLQGNIELVLSTFKPGSSSHGTVRREAEEAGLVLSGTLGLWIEDKHFVLKEGSTFKVARHESLHWQNSTDSDAVLVWVLAPPAF